MEPSSQENRLADAIYEAAQNAARKLFSIYKNHHFYYFALVTDGEAHAPFISAWSREALQEASADSADPDMDAAYLKWSYADSPFCFFGEDFFSVVNELFAARPEMSHKMSQAEWHSEFRLRISAMESALKRLDETGVFGRGTDRLGIVINVEVVPPDHSNTERARRLNPNEALTNWLAEIAEPPT